LLRQGHDVLLDYGFSSQEFRDECNALIEGAGARWRLLYFDVDPEELKRRLHERNQHDDANLGGHPFESAQSGRLCIAGVTVPAVSVALLPSCQRSSRRTTTGFGMVDQAYESG
jgi:AAA domain